MISNTGDLVIHHQLEKTTRLFDLKRGICDTFHKYYQFPKFHFFMFGPQHSARAAAVLKVIMSCEDLETIKEILNHQIKIMKGVNFIAQRAEIEKFTALGLDKRYVIDNGLKNKSSDLSKSKYFKALEECVRLVEEAKTLGYGVRPETMTMK